MGCLSCQVVLILFATALINGNHFTHHWNGPPLGGDMVGVYWCITASQNKPDLEERGNTGIRLRSPGMFLALGRTARRFCNCSRPDHGYLLNYPNLGGEEQSSAMRLVFHTPVGRGGWVAWEGSLERCRGTLMFAQRQEVRMRNGSSNNWSNSCCFPVKHQISQKEQLMERKVYFGSWYGV